MSAAASSSAAALVPMQGPLALARLLQRAMTEIPFSAKPPATTCAATPAMTPMHRCCRLQEEADKSRRLTGKQFFLQQVARVDGKDEVLTSLPAFTFAC